MMRHKSYKATAAVVLASLCAASGALAGDQAKAIVNSLDPKSLNELFEALPQQPDAALTNITPTGPNKFRFLFIWPASNASMTYDRVGRSFAERFIAFAGQLNPIATGFCLTSRSMLFGTTTYGEEEVNVAYRDIEVRYPFGWQAPCPGRYIPVSELDKIAVHPTYGTGFGASPPEQSKEPKPPEEGLKPFLSAPAAPPPLE
jgi:hypothetical protein